MNKKMSFFGLLLMHSFKKMILASGLYIIAVLSLSFIRFRYMVVNEFYLPLGRAVDIYRDSDVITNYKEIFMTSYFAIFSIIFFGYIAYVVISSTFKIYENNSVVNRISIPEKDIKIASFTHYILSIFATFFVIVIAYYLMARLYVGYFDFGYLDKPYLYLRATENSFMRLFYIKLASIMKIVIVFVVGVILYGFSNYKNENVKPGFASVMLTLLLVLFG